MVDIKTGTLSKIADILADNNKSPINPATDVWKKIFCNAELEHLYLEKEPQYRVTSNFVDEKYFNDRTYNALYETFKGLQFQFEDLVKLLNSIANKMYIYRIFSNDAEKKIKRETTLFKEDYLDELFRKLDGVQINKFLSQYSNPAFQSLKINLNNIGLDISHDCDGFCIRPFTQNYNDDITELDIVSQWLYTKYNNVFQSYEDAKKSFGNGDKTACITHCRNIITGIFSYKKDDGTEWYRGLHKMCYQDKNIQHLTNSKKISETKYNVHSPKVEERYQYPRFNLINRIYVFTCDLGAHINEGNISDGEIEHEVPTMEDALFALRMTENVLIWLYQTGNMDI